MNNYEFKYEQRGQISSEDVKAPDMKQARSLFHVTHPQGLSHILAVIIQQRKPIWV
jgi:hypothetical protein